MPAVGLDSNSFRAVSGLGTAQIGLFSGAAYYGRQGTQIAGDGSAGGAVYGGVFSYFPTAVWHASVSIDRVINVSNINVALPNQQSISNLPLSGAPVPTNASVHVTATAFKSDYAFSEQTSMFGVIGYTRTDYTGTPRVDNSWLASVGIRQKLTDRLTLSFDYQYTNVVSNQPQTSFTRNYTALGATYNF